MNEIIVKDVPDLAAIEKEVIEYMDAMGITDKLLPSEKKMFINIAQSFNLSPFKREIHITAYGQGQYRKCSVITGYEVYIKRAERTGKLDGWKVWTEGIGNDLKAVVEIYRKDRGHPFVHEVYYSECVQLTKEGRPNSVWAKMPRFMCKKVGIGQAFRLCFSDELGGFPYEASEVPQEERNVTEPPSTQESIQEKSEQEKSEKEERSLILKEIAEIMTSKDPDLLPLFYEGELNIERELARKGTLEQLKAQKDRLKAELENRKAKFEPIPFENDIPWHLDKPSMYNEPEPENAMDIF